MPVWTRDNFIWRENRGAIERRDLGNTKSGNFLLVFSPSPDVGPMRCPLQIPVYIFRDRSLSKSDIQKRRQSPSDFFIFVCYVQKSRDEFKYNCIEMRIWYERQKHYNFSQEEKEEKQTVPFSIRESTMQCHHALFLYHPRPVRLSSDFVFGSRRRDPIFVIGSVATLQNVFNLQKVRSFSALNFRHK